MSGRTYHLLDETGAPLDAAGQIDDFLSAAFSSGADWLAVPRARLGRDFFDLSTRLLGETAQKFRNYGVGLAVLGDVSGEAAASLPFRDFVRETNQGDAFWFVPDETTLSEKLNAAD